MVYFFDKAKDINRVIETLELLMQEAERRARRRGSLLIHLNTYSFQAPGFYEKLGFRRFGGMEGSPAGASRHFYAKRLTRS